MKKIKILMIEDDRILRENTADFLMEENFEVFTACDGKKGLDMVQVEFPDIIICDILMPEMDGYEVFYNLQKNSSTAQIPFIFLTAKTQDYDIRAGMGIGADDYITKPFLFEDLLISIKSRLARKQKIIDGNDEKFRSFTESSPTGVFIVSDGIIEYANKQFFVLTGYDEIDLDKLKFDDLLPEQERNDTGDELRTAMKLENNLFSGEFNLAMKNGDARQVIINGRTSLIKNRMAFIGNMLDVSEKKGITDQIQMVKKEKELTLNCKKEFLSNISHELRTPMNGILGMTELLLGEIEKAKHRQCLEIIYQSANELMLALNELIEISIIKSGEYEITSQPFVLSDAITDALTPIYKYANDKKLGFVVQTDESCKQLIKGDESKIKQVIYYLVHNAVKFSDTGQVTVKAKCEERIAGKLTFNFMVEDNGIGISAEKQDMIFKSFYQADGSLTRKNNGLGLGLTITKKIIELMNGKLWMQTEPGKGSIFCFVLELKAGG